MADELISLPRTTAAFLITLTLLVAQSTYWGITGAPIFGGALYWPTLTGWALASIACMAAIMRDDIKRHIGQSAQDLLAHRDQVVANAIVALASTDAIPAAPRQHQYGLPPQD